MKQDIYYKGRIYKDFSMNLHPDPDFRLGVEQLYLPDLQSYQFIGEAKFKDGQEVKEGIDYVIEPDMEDGSGEMVALHPLHAVTKKELPVEDSKEVKGCNAAKNHGKCTFPDCNCNIPGSTTNGEKKESQDEIWDDTIDSFCMLPENDDMLSIPQSSAIGDFIRFAKTKLSIHRK